MIDIYIYGNVSTQSQQNDNYITLSIPDISPSERKARDFGPSTTFHNSFNSLFDDFLFPNLLFSILSQFVICSLIA